jgi:serine phosphatase RsbU (regulator of sigma subunit)
MAYTHTRSVAFRQALLKSERLRIRIVLGAIGGAFLLRTIRAAIVGGSENLHSWLTLGALLSLFLTYEFLTLLAVDRAIQKGRELANSFWFSNSVLETSLPALAIVFLSGAPIDPAYRPLANPAVLVFFLFIILSTLRLDPALCRVSGLAAAASYLAAAAWLGWKPSMSRDISLLSPQRAVIGYALSFIIGGIVAGMIAGEIRKQVNAALLEAEMLRQLDRIERDLAVARSIQQSLLPNTMPDIEGFEIAAWNQPADQTGGDYYDWQFLPDGDVVVTLADVTGHGIGPALLAAVCQAYARANFRLGNGLFNTMEQMNAALAVDVGEGRFVTFVAVVCSPGDSLVQLLSAGHGPLFFYLSKEDRFDQLNAHGLPFGISSSLISDPPQMIELHPNDILVLATDGFFEWANAQDELFGLHRLEEAIRRSKNKPARELISDLYQAVLEFSGGTKQNDDLTVVVIKRTPGGSSKRASPEFASADSGPVIAVN